MVFQTSVDYRTEHGAIIEEFRKFKIVAIKLYFGKEIAIKASSDAYNPEAIMFD